MGYETGSGLEFYSPDVTFHNQNGAVYHGGDKMWAWMKKLSSVFERIRHDHIHLVEIERDDGTTQIYQQGIRNLWLVGEEGEEPTVSIPVTFIAVVGKSGGGVGEQQTPEGLCFKEVWIYWDTALLLPFLAKDAVVFRTKNVLREGEGVA